MALISNIACVCVFVFFAPLTKEIAARIAAWYRARNASDSFSGSDTMYAQNSRSAMNLSSGVAAAEDAIEIQKNPTPRITALLIIHHADRRRLKAASFAGQHSPGSLSSRA
ncbi:hypothetical protein QMO14_14690 [Variovorax sp. CAN2819]|uniref:hypothetical protein n=1 Tax=Variovorax sp. CAN15 TaxID=3046727 RepID=UPI0026489360|nr:hypothetical protein [Variovorax sp. CAN15]MDN6884848.1 hypothetical protein [Variovorax sp. CAN15]